MDVREILLSTRTSGSRRAARPRAIRAGRGFTTTELLVMMAVMGIVLAASLPNFRAMLEGHRFKSAVDTVITRLFATRQMAVRDKIPYVVDLDTGAAQINVFADNDGDGVFESGERRFGPYELGPNIALVNVSWPNNQLTFLPNGTASQTGDVQVIDGKGRTKTIRVSSTTGSAGVLP